jgi:ligand-binding sensor domain-containing protein
VARHAKFLSINDSAFKGWVEKVVPWDRKSVLVSSGGGLFLVDRETGAVSRPRLPHVAGLDLDTIPLPVLYPESPQKLWIGTITHGLYLLDRVSGSVTGYHKGPIGGSRSRDGRIQELQLDGKGRMWIATGDGIDLFDPVSGEYKEFLPNGQAPGKSMFTRMSADSTGILWISTADDGLYLLPPASFRFAHYALRGPSGWPMEMETITLQQCP